MTAQTASHAPTRNLMIYLDAPRAPKKPPFRLTVVDANFTEQAPEAANQSTEPSFAFVRLQGRICYLRRVAG
jgi:hypothetical protein